MITVTLQEEREEIREGLYRAMRDEVYELMRERDVPYREAVRIFWEEKSEESLGLSGKAKEILEKPLTDETLQKYGWDILCDPDEDDDEL
jgi:hypothetical protein